jgi:hypothetical protein
MPRTPLERTTLIILRLCNSRVPITHRVDCSLKNSSNSLALFFDRRPRLVQHFGSWDFGLWMQLNEENPKLLTLDPPKFVDVRSMNLVSPQLDDPYLLFFESGFRNSCWIVLQHFELLIPALSCFESTLKFFRCCAWCS